MKAKVRRRIEMGRRALEFSRAHPHEASGYIDMQTRLEGLLSHGEELMQKQRDGILGVGAAARRKEELRRTMKRCHLAYLSRLGKAVAAEDLELAHKLAPGRGSRAYFTFRSTAGAIASEAISRKELLERHGLAGSVLEELVTLLDEFDRAEEELIEARRVHVGASVGIERIGHEIVRLVQVMDGFNRVRFAGDAGSHAEWVSASKVLAASAKQGEEAA